MVIVAGPQAVVGGAQAGDLVVINELGADPVAALPILLAHGIGDEGVHLVERDHGQVLRDRWGLALGGPL